MLMLHRVALGLGVVAVLARSDALACPGNATADDTLVGVNLTGKLAVVTGGDSGLGFETASALARRGASIVIASHNVTKTEIAAASIHSSTGAKVIPMELDLSSLASVREFANRFLTNVSTRLDMLVNDAGIHGPSVESRDGFELVSEVSYFGHFLLTELLLPALRNSSGTARIVNVGSDQHETACEQAGWPEGCFKDWSYLPPPVVPVRNVTVHYGHHKAMVPATPYGAAKFLVAQHAAALARLEKDAGIEAFSVTPGHALTHFFDHFDWNSSLAKALCAAQVHPDPSLPPNPCPFSAAQGAAPITFCLSGRARTSGAYYSRTFACEERPIVMHGFTEAMQLELYRRSLAWVGLAPHPQTTSAQYV